MIPPVKREKLRRLQDNAEESTKNFKNRIVEMRSSVKPKTIAKVVDEHPIATVCAAAIGGCALSGILGFRSLRIITMIAAQTVARSGNS